MGIEEIISYNFKNKKLLEEALAHPSCVSRIDGTRSYERMEFLGDSVLGFVISELLFEKFPNEPEGDLAKRRSALVCGETLSQLAIEIHLGNYIKFSVGEEKNNGRENKANLEDAFEALIAALYLDGGIEVARAFVLKHLENRSLTMKTPPKDPKTTLQEWAQAKKLNVPTYVVIAQIGPSHSPVFTIEVRVDGYESVISKGKSKRLAEREAAKVFLKNIGVSQDHSSVPQ